MEVINVVVSAGGVGEDEGASPLADRVAEEDDALFDGLSRVAAGRIGHVERQANVELDQGEDLLDVAGACGALDGRVDVGVDHRVAHDDARRKGEVAREVRAREVRAREARETVKEDDEW